MIAELAIIATNVKGNKNDSKNLNIHGGGRARNSDRFVRLYYIPLKKYIFQVIAKKQVSTLTHTLLV